MLGQGLDRRQRLQFLSAHPVISELLGMESCPRSDESQRTRWKRPIENPHGGQLDLSDIIAVLGVEVRRWMIGTVHPDDDSVERGQAGHRAIVSDSTAETAYSSSEGSSTWNGQPSVVTRCSWWLNVKVTVLRSLPVGPS
jgi:hypothetical protein